MNTNVGNLPYDVAIVGGGASGTALLYTLAKYTDIKRIILIEKYDTLGSVNSNATNNSQTLHIGEIETNYTIEKARQVYSAAMMVKRYVDGLTEKGRNGLMRSMQKMVLAVGNPEVEILDARYANLKTIYPFLQKLDAEGIALVEPEVMRSRDKNESVRALYNPEGYAVNYRALSESFATQAQVVGGARAEVIRGKEVAEIIPTESEYILRANGGNIRAKTVIIDTDAYSLGFAKSLGYGKEFSLIPIAGSFYFSAPRLRGKVYRVQIPGMPFAAVHGDADLTTDATRWGPTARLYPALEARKLSTIVDFFRASGLGRPRTWLSFALILLDAKRFWYLLRNLFYDIPYFGTRFLLLELRKIVPTLRASDLRPAAGYGGMRLQRVDTNTRELLLGEGKIIGDRIIFNMTPSPGASVSLYNAMRDASSIATFLPDITFNKKDMLRDLCIDTSKISEEDVSLKSSYAS